VSRLVGLLDPGLGFAIEFFPRYLRGASINLALTALERIG